MVQGNPDKLSVVLTLYDAATATRYGVRISRESRKTCSHSKIRFTAAWSARSRSSRPAKKLASSGTHPTENVKAYDLYLQGRNALRNSHNAASCGKPDRCSSRRSTRIPILLWLMLDWPTPASGSMARARRVCGRGRQRLAAQQAERLSSTLPEVHLSLGSVYSTTGKNAPGDHRTETRARTWPRIPMRPTAGWRRISLQWTKATKAVAAYQSAVAANPYFWMNHNAFGNRIFQPRRHRQSIAIFSEGHRTGQ